MWIKNERIKCPRERENNNQNDEGSVSCGKTIQVAASFQYLNFFMLNLYSMNECECKLKDKRERKRGVFVVVANAMRHLIRVSCETGAEKGTARESSQISLPEKIDSCNLISQFLLDNLFSFYFILWLVFVRPAKTRSSRTIAAGIRNSVESSGEFWNSTCKWGRRDR